MAAELEWDSLWILNDDCIYAILEWLPLVDICSLSRTCNCLRSMCANHFRRKYPRKFHQKVRLWLNGHQTFDEYVKYFYNFIRNVEILTYEWADSNGKLPKSNRKQSLAVDFVKKKCDRDALHKIGFDRDVELVAFGKEVESFLHNVKVVEFGDRRYRGYDEANFLKLCPNMTKLVLSKYIPALNAYRILQQQYQQLTHFNYIDCNAIGLNVKQLELFFKLNHQIKSVAWCFGINGFRYEDSRRDHSTLCIESVKYASNLQQLFLSINSPYLRDNFERICEFLSFLCCRSNFKRLEIAFERNYGAAALISCASQLSHFKQLAKIHLKNVELVQVMAAVQSLGHLKAIVLNVSRHDYDRDDKLDTLDTLDVEEVQVETFPDNDTDLSDPLVDLFVKKWINLKRIMLLNTDCTLDIFDMNRDRHILTNASPVTIFTNYENTNMNFDFVKIRFAEFQTGCDECPLQNHCMTRTNYTCE